MSFRAVIRSNGICTKLNALNSTRSASSRSIYSRKTDLEDLSSKWTKRAQPTVSRLARKQCLCLSAARFSQQSQVEEEEAADDLYRQIDVEVKGHDPEVLNSYEKFVTMAANELDIDIGSISTPPKVITRRTLLKSVHIFKKHRVQYEWRTHFRQFEFKHLTGSTADTFLEYIQRNLPEGVAMKVTRYRLEELPEHLASAIESRRRDGAPS